MAMSLGLPRHTQVPLLDRSAPFLNDIALSKDGVIKLLIGLNPSKALGPDELFIRFTASAFRKLLSIYVFSCFPFDFEDRMCDLIVSVPDHCLSFYFSS